ncbi:PfkB family carbohydrate kinase, partial [Acinetobacter baumannii]|uniref:PfkB family carbohydrate kinase n=1 Tax=Acinetobacter baumannii TaxID=470 RepID=UPI000B15B4AA
LDRYWHGGTSRISPEAPVPVVKVEQIEDRPGGAANVALNIAALGSAAALVGVTGEDEARQSLLDRYWHGGTSRISPEAPVPVVKVEQIEDRPGG